MEKEASLLKTEAYNVVNTFGRMAEDLNQLLIESAKYEDYVKWQKHLCWEVNQTNLGLTKFCLDFPVFLLTIHQSDYFEINQIPQEEASAEASMATSLVDVHLVQPITNIYCSTNICT